MSFFIMSTVTELYRHWLLLPPDAGVSDFEDNYFDILPGDRHAVIWRGSHRQGTLQARCAGQNIPVTFPIPNS